MQEAKKRLGGKTTDDTNVFFGVTRRKLGDMRQQQHGESATGLGPLLTFSQRNNFAGIRAHETGLTTRGAALNQR